MSLPWKKSKSSRISRFMSEFQQSPKRGASLVVETGFPTSLIDLFVKNRDRLKKSSSSKRLKRQTQTAPNVSSPTNPNAILTEKPAKRETTVENKIKKTAENKNAVEKNGCVCDCGVSGSGNGSCVLTAFKILIVALLALSTKKKLTLGITLSTLALLLTELVAARVFTRSNLKHKEKPNVENVFSGEKTETLDDSNDYSGETEHVDVTEKPSSKDSTIRDLLLKTEKKSKSKTSRLTSKLVKKLKSYRKTKKNKKETIVIKEESLTRVSSLTSEEKPEEAIIESAREEKESNKPLMGANANGIVVIGIVLMGLISGKMFALVLTLSCLFLRFQATKLFGRCI